MRASGRARPRITAALLLAVLLAGCALAGPAGAASPPSPPAVVFIGAAGLSWTDVGAAREPLLAALATGAPAATGTAPRRAAAGSAAIGPTAIGSTAVGSAAIGSTAIGSTAVGSAAIGSTAIGSTAIGSTAVGSAAVGSLSVRSAQTPTCPVDGWLTLGSGQRATGPARSAGRCPGIPAPTSAALTPGSTAAVVDRWPRAVDVAGFADLVTTNHRASYGASPGLLGNALAAGGRCVTAVGAGAALATATSAGRVARWAPRLSMLDAAALTRCPLTVVDAGVGAPAAEAALAAVLARAPADATVIVAGIADGGPASRPEPALGLLAVSTANGRRGLLTSASTRWPGVATLTDLTPTLLSALRIAEPAHPAPAGAPIVVAAGAAPGLATLQATAIRARVAGAQVGNWFTVAGLGGLVVLAALAVGLRRPGRPHRAGQAGRAVDGSRVSGRPGSALAAGLRVGALALFCLPVATRLASLVPWWTSGAGSGLAGGVPNGAVHGDGRRAALLWAVQAAWALALAVLAAGTGAVARRRSHGSWVPLVPVTVLALVEVVVTVVDVATGSPLSRLAVIGLLPIDGSRFHGLGNEIVAATDTSLLLGSCLAVVPLVRRGRRLLAAGVVGATGVGFVLVDGLPGLGDDLGGVPATVAGAGVAALLVSGARLRAGRLVALAGIAVAAGVALALGDAARAPANRTHVGDFVISLRDGGGGTVLARKAGSVLGPFAGATGVPAAIGAWVGLIVVTVLGVVLLRPHSTVLDRLTPVWPTWRAALGGTAVAAVVGALLNDSGVIILLIAAGLSIMAVAAVLAPSLAGDAGSVGPAAGPAASAGPPD